MRVPPKGKSLTVKTGVLIAPPFSTLDTTMMTFGGFQVDLLNRLKVFALQDDNVQLEFTLSQTQQNYAGAFDMVANDCNTTVNPLPLDDCQLYDIVVADYYVNPARAIRVDFTPAWLQTSMSTIEFLDKTISPDYTTLSEASKAGATVCLPGGTYIMEVVQAKWPDGVYLSCEGQDDCQAKLKGEECVLYVEDELQLHYRAAVDPSLKVTGETFNTQYLVWAMKDAIDPSIRLLMKKWMYSAVANATMDELYFSYFQKELCPIGTAGDKCELPCHPIHGASNEQGICECESQRWTGADCSLEVAENLNHIQPLLKVIGMILLGINVILVVGCAVWLFWKRNAPQVRVSQPFFLGLVLVGCLVSSSTILWLGLEDNKGDDEGDDNNEDGGGGGNGSSPPCMTIPWFYSVGFSITFGTLFAKIRRVYLIFTSAAGPRQRSAPVTWQETLCLTGIVLLLDVIVLAIWTLVDPLTWIRIVLLTDKFGYSLESYGICDGSWITFGSIIASYHVILLGIASYMCYVARDIPGEFSESKYIAMAMISNFQIMLIGIPVLILIGSDPSTSYFVRSTMVWINDFMVVVLIFGNLIHATHFSEKANDKGDIRTMVGSAIKRYSESQQHQHKRNSAGSELFSSGSTPSGGGGNMSRVGDFTRSELDSLAPVAEEDDYEHSTSFRVTKEQSPPTTMMTPTAPPVDVSLPPPAKPSILKGGKYSTDSGMQDDNHKAVDGDVTINTVTTTSQVQGSSGSLVMSMSSQDSIDDVGCDEHQGENARAVARTKVDKIRAGRQAKAAKARAAEVAAAAARDATVASRFSSNNISDDDKAPDTKVDVSTQPLAAESTTMTPAAGVVETATIQTVSDAVFESTTTSGEGENLEKIIATLVDRQPTSTEGAMEGEKMSGNGKVWW
jgi:ABC-type amino acid transport substrate-binding protein